MLGFLLPIASAILLTAGSELLAEHASAAGRRFGVTDLAIGLVLAGAEPEERNGWTMFEWLNKGHGVWQKTLDIQCRHTAHKQPGHSSQAEYA